MKKADIRKPIFALSLTTLLSIALGYGEWVIIASQKLNSPATSSEKKVCSIGNTYYTTVEAALTAAENNPGADTIYVIPGANPTLSVNPVTGKNTFLLSSNDKMIVAFYSDVDKKTVYVNSKTGINTNQSSITIKNTLTIGSGVTFNVEGTLETSGRLNAGDGGQAYAGNTYGDCTRILLDANAKIACSGTINCYGYIEETTTDNGSSLEMASGSSLYMPFIIRDFRGGTTSSAIKAGRNGCFLFNQYELKNISVRTTLDYGAKLFAWGNLNMQGIRTLDLNMVGPSNSFLFQTTDSNDSKILYYHVPDSNENNGNSLKGKSEITFIGGVDFNSISINLVETINSGDYYFPFCFYFSFKFMNPVGKGSSSFSIPHKAKIMTGCNFEIGENCTVTIGDMIIYNVFNDDSQGVGGQKYPSKEPAKVWNKGTINATNLAGCVINDGTVNISGNRTLTSREAWKQTFVAISEWAIINANYSEFTSDFAATNNRILISTKNVDSPPDAVSYKYRAKTLNGYYTDYVAANTSISLSKWSHIQSITINGSSYSDGNNHSVNGPTKIEITPESGCFAKGTLILLANGSCKPVESLCVGDEILIMNHDTGKLEPGFVAYIFENGNEVREVMNLIFDKNTNIEVLYGHCFFDKSLCKYIEIRPDNVLNFIGHEFYYFDSLTKRGYYTKLEKVEYYQKETPAYAVVSAYHMNCVANGFVNITDDIAGLYNYFDYDENLKYDADKKKKDIDKYGLYEYSEWSDWFTPEEFELFAVKYLKISVGKKLLTEEKIKEYVNLYFR